MIIVYKSTGTEAISCLSPIASDRIGSGENKKENLPHTRETMTKLSLSLSNYSLYSNSLLPSWLGRGENKCHVLFVVSMFGPAAMAQEKNEKKTNKEAKEYSNNK